jgi:LysM repeat protein
VCGTYTIKAGDTLDKLSENMYFDIKEFLTANPIVKPDKLPVGHKVGVPCRLTQHGGTGIARGKLTGHAGDVHGPIT